MPTPNQRQLAKCERTPVAHSEAASRIAAVRPLSRRLIGGRPGAWLLAAAILAAVGVAASLFAAHQVSQSDAQKSKVALHSSAVEIAANVELGLQREEDLNLAAGAFVVDHSSLTETSFMTWAHAIQLKARYPELQGIVWIDFVTRSELPTFEAHANSGQYVQVSRGAFTIVPSGARPDYCLLALSISRAAAVAARVHEDYCEIYPLLVLRDSGQTLASATRLPTGLATLALATPIYVGGTVPKTVAARRAAFLGWTAVSVLPHVLLATALRGHRGTAIVLRRDSSGSALTFSAGSAKPHAQEVTVNLEDGSTLEVLGAAAGGGIFGDSGALALLIGGIVLSALLGALVLILGTGRARAIGLVVERTRELADEARLSASARDDAVEASNAKSVFVASVSHELRTPLSGVIGTAELLLETDLDAEQREYADIVRTSSEGLLLVINDILDYSKIEAGKLELNTVGFALSELIAESCALVLPIAHEKGLEVKVHVDHDLPGWLEGDAARIRQILINLLSNAVKFTNKGRVTVHASATPTSPTTSMIRVQVTDTGIGIDDETLSRLFQPFSQADNSTARKYGGTGLGLTISSQLIELMGGNITAHSVPGKGSTFAFEVELPLADQADQTTHPPVRFAPLGERDSDGSLSDSAPLVLIAEDNPVNQMLASRLLDRCGYRSEVVADGNQALEASANTSYAAILMDCQMPELDGYAATEAIRRRETPQEHIPIIATTAHSMSGDREKCLEAGMDDYISKPIRATELRDALTRSIKLAHSIQAAGRS